MHLKPLILALTLVMWAPEYSWAAKPCVSTLHELRLMLGCQTFPLRWIESTDDKAPLVIDILEKNGQLSLALSKSSEGLWAEGAGTICAGDHAEENQFMAEKIAIGPAANWLLRQFIGQRETVSLRWVGTEQLKVATSNWNGTFKPR